MKKVIKTVKQIKNPIDIGNLYFEGVTIYLMEFRV